MNSPGITDCRVLGFVQHLLLNLQLDDVLQGVLARNSWTKERSMLGIAGIISHFHGLGADGVPKPARSFESGSPDGVGWELSLPSSSVLSVRGLKET